MSNRAIFRATHTGSSQDTEKISNMDRMDRMKNQLNYPVNPVHPCLILLQVNFEANLLFGSSVERVIPIVTCSNLPSIGRTQL